MVLIIVNLKAYREGYGQRAHRIAEASEEVSEESGVTIGVAPNFMDLHPLSHHFGIPVYAQHVDGISPGSHTGHILAEAIRQAGARGTLINHSERRLTLADVQASVARSRESGLETVVCTNNEATSAAAAAFEPDYIAIEPPELIGGSVSVSEADPGVITRSVAAAQRISPSVRVLAGAGIHSGKCVKTAVDLGCEGVLLASSVVKADDPAKVLRDLVSLL